MPEGDTIHRTAIALRTALVGKPMTSFSAPRLSGPVPAIGRTIETVSIRGKHIEMVWDDGLTLHTNLRLIGTWHLYHVDERWRKRTDQMRVAIEVDEWVAVCFSAPVIETYRQFDRYRHPGFGRLGPDLCQRNADLHEVLDRVLDYFDPEAPVAEVLLDQQVACGIGNVYRSEVLWAIELSPFAAVGSLTVEDAQRAIATSARLLQANLNDARRTPVAEAGGALAVYGRNGQRCGRCGDTILVKRIGELNRLLYWCPGCQARLDSRSGGTPATGAERPIDPHPAAAMYLSTLPWNRHPDDLDFQHVEPLWRPDQEPEADTA